MYMTTESSPHLCAGASSPAVSSFWAPEAASSHVLLKIQHKKSY